MTLEERIISIEKNQKRLLDLMRADFSPYYTIDTLAIALNKSSHWVYKNKHLFADAIVVVNPNTTKIQFSKKIVHQIIEANSSMFRRRRA